MASYLYYGSRGSEVERLQDLLNRRLNLSPPLLVDGMFGPRTDAAVRQLQAKEGTTVDGVVGTKTWAVLEGDPDEFGDRMVWARPASCNAPWMAVAEREMGQTEWPKMLHNPRILQYFSATSTRASADEVPWCSAFVNWCMKQVGIAGTNSARAVDWVPWGTAAGPTVGAITVVRRVTGENHVVFLLSETASEYRLLGGNQRNKVKISKYPKSEYLLLGYRWPK